MWSGAQRVTIYRESYILSYLIDRFGGCITILYGKYMVYFGSCLCIFWRGGKKYLPPQHCKKGLCLIYIKRICIYSFVLYYKYHMEYNIRGGGDGVVGIFAFSLFCQNLSTYSIKEIFIK